MGFHLVTDGCPMVVRDVGTVLDWMRGTRQLIVSDDPATKALAVQKFRLQSDASRLPPGAKRKQNVPPATSRKEVAPGRNMYLHNKYFTRRRQQ
jgi:hypothetical protein